MKTQLSFLRLEKHKNDFRETTLHPIGLRNVARRIKGVWSPSFQSGTINLIHVSIVVSPEQKKKISPPRRGRSLRHLEKPFSECKNGVRACRSLFLRFWFWFVSFWRCRMFLPPLRALLVDIGSPRSVCIVCIVDNKEQKNNNGGIYKIIRKKSNVEISSGRRFFFCTTTQP